ncbi:hypothetical protein VNO78_28525 [Psophocarpus tetragonolobus]|uniref:Uncharacterized protein n=1 Tax=Psophocarpus tetragonolobus TaxID=3891 RepID=A0AAN9S1S5_PSOTE
MPIMHFILSSSLKPLCLGLFIPLWFLGTNTFPKELLRDKTLHLIVIGFSYNPSVLEQTSKNQGSSGV